MTTNELLLLSLLIFAAAALYSSVGHAGASGYIAAMALFGTAPTVMKPTALCLNILVATIAAYRFWRAGAFGWRTFYPFAATSIPFAFLGGALQLPTTIYKQIVGVALLFAAVRLFQRTLAKAAESETHEAPLVAALPLGALIGLLSGLTGVGGGIFLSPLLLLMNWADARRTAGVSAAFILVNSIAGLAGNYASVKSLPATIPYLAVAALLGGLLGAELGSRRLAGATIRRVLAVVLVVAGMKLIFT
ncbi:MAG: sulfite exporter TauE/SafE family protein [Pyrinomonadaceae bacterium]